ncbi:retrotransposon protein, putative, ty1-copia subclass [Tanacetum coccineum]
MGCGTHIYSTTQGLRGSKKLKLGALNLYMGNGHHVAIEAIGTFHLCLPSGLVVVFNNCHFSPSITRWIILVSRLYDGGFVNHLENNAILVSKNNLVYFHVILRDGIYEFDLHNSNKNDSSMYVVSNKRAKLNLDSTLLWHCHLGHISKKRIEKLQHDGLLNSTYIESFDKCISCLFGTMARKPYSHQVEKAKDLLRLIHTDALVKRNTLTKPDKLEPRSIKCIFVGYPKEMMGYSFYYPPENKVLVAQNTKFFENSLITQEASGILEDLEIIKDKNTNPSKKTSLHHDEDDQEIDEPQSDIDPVRRSIRTRHALDRMCLYVDAEEHKLGDLNEPANYKAALLDLESDKWLAAMNVEMQSMKDNQV